MTYRACTYLISIVYDTACILIVYRRDNVILQVHWTVVFIKHIIELILIYRENFGAY